MVEFSNDNTWLNGSDISKRYIKIATKDPMMKWDGHTHSQFCRHGSGDDTTAMIEKAINLKYDKYSITEHAPLPSQVISDPEMRADFGLTWDEVDDYFSHIQDLKRIYGRKIQILAGLEVDYLDGLEAYTEDLLIKLSQNLEDVLISVHFIKGNKELLPIDYSPESFKMLIDYFGTVDNVHIEYWKTVKKLIATDLDGLKNRRIGHLGLINKFTRIYPATTPDFKSRFFYENLFRSLKEHNWTVDFDVGGLNYKHCQETYLPEVMQYWCSQLQIEIIYGSDAHNVDAVGKHYNLFEEIQNANQ